jgi:hypothetical protein
MREARRAWVPQWGTQPNDGMCRPTAKRGANMPGRGFKSHPGRHHKTTVKTVVLLFFIAWLFQAKNRSAHYFAHYS